MNIKDFNMELIKKIHLIAKKNQYLTFDEYMNICLYYPDLGYYNNKNISLDTKNSDFITAPELTEIYTDSIVTFYLKCKKYKKLENILEFGAGSGKMAYNFLKNIDHKNLPKKYYIVEKSIYLRNQQKNKLKDLPKKLFDKIEWIEEIKNIDNIFLISNEVFDALPSKIFYKENNLFYEKIIISKDNKLYFSKKNCENKLKEEINQIESRIGYKIPNNYTFELNTSYDKFLSNIYNNINNFVFIIIDYGYSENEFYHLERKHGTIQFYKDHKKIKDPFNDQGNFDISVSVDFSRIRRISELYNIKLLGYTTQTQFLLSTNILDNSSKIKDDFEKNNILKTLLFPTDMGENFKIMVLCDDINNKLKIDFKDFRHKL